MLNNKTMNQYKFLEEMYGDGYFPDFLVDKGTEILLRVCKTIEEDNIQNLDSLYKITHKATDEFNELNEEFGENGSEIETMARDCISINFLDIAKAYGFDADIEELTATRDW